MIYRWSRCGKYAHCAKSSHYFKRVILYTHIKEVCRYIFTTRIECKAQVDVLLPLSDTEQQELSTNVPLLEAITNCVKDNISDSDNNSSSANFIIKGNITDTTNNNDHNETSINECVNTHVCEEMFEEMLQLTSIVAFAQHVSAILREMPEFHGILPVPLKVLQHCYSLALNAPARTRRSSSQIALEISKQVRLLQTDLLSREEQAMLDLHFAALHAHAGHWHKAKNLVHCNDAIDYNTKEQFYQNLARQEKCETIVAQWKRTPLLTSTDDVCYAITHLTDWEAAFDLLTQYELHSHQINHVRSTLLARADVSANMTWQHHYKFFSELPRNEQKYNIARTLIRRIPFANENYIIIISDVLQHTALTMSSATLARWLYNAQRRQNWCFAIALGCAARYYDVVLPWLQFLTSDKSSSSTSSSLRSKSSLPNKSVNFASLEQDKKALRVKRKTYKTRYIIPPQLIHYEKTLVELEQVATLAKVLNKKESSDTNNETNNYQNEESNSDIDNTSDVVTEKIHIMERSEEDYSNNDDRNNRQNENKNSSCERSELETELTRAHTPLPSKVELNNDAPFEVCLACALHGDWRHVMHIPCVMADRRLRALCNAMIAFTSAHDDDKNKNRYCSLNQITDNIMEGSNNRSEKSKQNSEVKLAKGKECFYFDSIFFSQVVFKHARQSAQERFLESIPLSEYAHYTDDAKALNLSLTPTQMHETTSSFLSTSSSRNLPCALDRVIHTLQSTTYTSVKQYNNHTSLHDKMKYLPSRVSNRKECAELFRFIHAELKETKSHHTKSSIRDITYFRLIAFCLAAIGPTSLLAHTREEYTLPLYMLKTASLLQIRLDATITVQLASSIPSPVIDKHLEVVAMLCDALLLLDRWPEVLPIYWRVYHKQHSTTVRTGNNNYNISSKSIYNDKYNISTYKSHDIKSNQTLLKSSHAAYSSFQHEQFIRLQEVVAKVAFYCHTNKREYNKFVQHIKQLYNNNNNTRICQCIIDLTEGNVRSVCEELERVERSLQTFYSNHMSKTHSNLYTREECQKGNALASLIEHQNNLHKREELLSAGFCLLHREDDLRTVLRAISQSHVAAVDLNAHGLQRLLRVLPTKIAVEALGEYAIQGHTIHTHWITLLMSRHDVQVDEVHLLSTLQPYVCEIQHIRNAVCALRSHDAPSLFSNLYKFYCSSLPLASSLSNVSWSTSHHSSIRTPFLRTLTLLLRSAVEDDTILSHALESYKTECNITTSTTENSSNNRNNTKSDDDDDDDQYHMNNANSIDNSSHAFMRMLYDKLSECKELNFSFRSSRRVLHPALHYSSTLHAILLAGAMHHLLGKSLQIPIPASFTSRLLKCSCAANVDWTVSWFYFRALRHPTRSERQRIVQSLSSVEWTDKIDKVVSYALLSWREFLFYAPEQVVVWCNARLGKVKWQVSLELSELFAAAESSETPTEETNTKAAKSVISVNNNNEECSEITNITISSSTSSNKGDNKNDVNNTGETENKIVDCKEDVLLNDDDAEWMHNDAFVMVQELIRDWAHHECARAIAFLERIGHVYAKCEQGNDLNNHVDSTSIANVKKNEPESKKNDSNKNTSSSNVNRKRMNKVNNKDVKAMECAQRVLKILYDHQSNCFPPQEHDTSTLEEANDSVPAEITPTTEINAETQSCSEDVSN